MTARNLFQQLPTNCILLTSETMISDCTKHCRSPVKFEASVTVIPSSFSLQAIQHQIINILDIKAIANIVC